MEPIWHKGGWMGGGEGVPENQQIKQNEKRKRKELKVKYVLFWKGGTIFSKFGGLNGWVFTVVL